MSAAIDLDPLSAHIAVLAAKPKSSLLLNRLNDLAKISESDLLEGIIPFDNTLRHSQDMIDKVRRFIITERDEPNLAKYEKSIPNLQIGTKTTSGHE